MTIEPDKTPHRSPFISRTARKKQGWQAIYDALPDCHASRFAFYLSRGANPKRGIYELMARDPMSYERSTNYAKFCRSQLEQLDFIPPFNGSHLKMPDEAVEPWLEQMAKYLHCLLVVLVNEHLNENVSVSEYKGKESFRESDLYQHLIDHDDKRCRALGTKMKFQVWEARSDSTHISEKWKKAGKLQNKTSKDTYFLINLLEDAVKPILINYLSLIGDLSSTEET
jgi:hypothetical protein